MLAKALEDPASARGILEFVESLLTVEVFSYCDEGELECSSQNVAARMACRRWCYESCDSPLYESRIRSTVEYCLWRSFGRILFRQVVTHRDQRFRLRRERT